jgi:transcriptional regulator with XRE-family HTH domain
VAKTFVGSRVRQLRSERGFSQAALAQMLETAELIKSDRA